METRAERIRIDYVKENNELEVMSDNSERIKEVQDNILHQTLNQLSEQVEGGELNASDHEEIAKIIGNLSLNGKTLKADTIPAGVLEFLVAVYETMDRDTGLEICLDDKGRLLPIYCHIYEDDFEYPNPEYSELIKVIKDQGLNASAYQIQPTSSNQPSTVHYSYGYVDSDGIYVPVFTVLDSEIAVFED